MMVEAKIGASEGSLQKGKTVAISAGVGQRTNCSAKGINKDTELLGERHQQGHSPGPMSREPLIQHLVQFINYCLADDQIESTLLVELEYLASQSG
jgi:hypothetical protein